MSIDLLVDDALALFPFKENPYFVALSRGELSKEEFLETQIQFFSAVSFFGRPMSMLMAKLPRGEQRLSVMHNVWDEHGEGDPSHFHRSTFLEFLKRLGSLTETDVYSRELWPEVRQFNTTLLGTSLMDEWMLATAMFGIIERQFSDISSEIARHIVERGWMKESEMIHYDLHAELDVAHAQGFFDLLAVAATRPEDAYYIRQGLLLGASSFMNLYQGMWQGRGRRWNKNPRWPHLRAPGV